MNDLFLWLNTANLNNFTDNNSNSAFSKDLQELIKTWKTYQNMQ